MTEHGETMRVRGLVQGVGFRPTVWRLARRHQLRGWVANDAGGVSIRVSGSAANVEAFAAALSSEAPPLARVELIERTRAEILPQGVSFDIVASAPAGTDRVSTGVVADAATCAECLREVLDPFSRRFRYPFTNCTHCGPRLAIVEAIPYDRATTTMRGFAMCAACRAEYDDPADRRFHAQPIACHACGPRAWLERADGRPIDTLRTLDAVDAACMFLQRGQIVAIKGLGGFQLACDACDEGAVARLRERKRRERKPFALMARDVDVLRRHCVVTPDDEALLASAAAPIVVMAALPASTVAAGVAPGLTTLGAMLPNTPLHHLVLRRMGRPIVLTSGNLSDEPQCIGDDDARERLAGIADYFLCHDRGIARRVDDSVERVVAGVARVLRLGRGRAPATLTLPAGFAAAKPLLAMGGELKNTFCVLRDGAATVSHHMGDLQNAPTYADYRASIAAYEALFAHAPEALAVDLHPEYLSGKLGREIAARRSLAVIEVQHHHAHVASCLAENGVALDAPPVLGVALDGLGFGLDSRAGGELWGGEFMAADYRSFTRLGTFKPVAMPGGEKAMREPWRNTYAHLIAGMGWPRFTMNFAGLELHRFLAAKPLAWLDAMIASRLNSPLASSCGRLFDAAAAAAGVCREHAFFEGQAAEEFEALVCEETLADEGDELAHPFGIARLAGSGLPYIEPLAVWESLLGDLIRATPVPVIAARFHKGLAIAIVRMVEKLCRHRAEADDPFTAVALSGGVFHNRVLLEQVLMRLEPLGLVVLSHRRVSPGDGGLSLGQAAVAAARLLAKNDTPCVWASPPIGCLGD